MTDVDTATGCALVASMTNEVVMRDRSIRGLLPLDPVRYGEAVLRGSANAPKRSFDDDPR